MLTTLPNTNDTPAVDDENAEQLRTFRKWFRQDSEHNTDWRKEAHEDYAFVASEQWSEDDRRALQDQLRPVITFNRIDPLIRSVAGEQINNAQEVRFLPREAGDARANELLTSAAGWFRDLCDADDEESESFWDACICGVGATESRLDFDEDPEEPSPVVERIDPFELLWDCNARKRNLSDARRIWRVKQSIPIEEARERYPDCADSDLDASWATLDEHGDKPIDNEAARRYESENTSLDSFGSKETVTIVQVQWWEYRTFFKVLDPFKALQAPDPSQIAPESIDEDAHAELKKNVKLVLKAFEANPPVTPEDADAQARFMSFLKDGELQSVKLRKRVYKQAFIGRKILKVKDSPCPDHFTFNFITGFRDRNKGQFYGLVRSMKDPQRWANKWMSQTLHIMNTSAKGGIMMEEGAVEDKRDFEKTYAKNDQVSWVNDGAIGNNKWVAKPSATFPQGFFALMEFAISSIRDVSGINLEMIGMREGNQPASLEFQRRQAGMTILAMLFRAMRRYHRNQGRVLLYFIQHHIAGDNPQNSRLIKIVGEEGAKYVPLVKQADAKYDVVVDEGPSSPNQKERVWALVGPMYETLPPDVQLIMLEYSPFPESVVAKIKEAAKKAQEGPQAQMQERMMQLEMAMAEVKVGLESAKTDKTKAETAQIASEIGRPTGVDGVPDQSDQHKLIEIASRERIAAQGQSVDLQKSREKLSADAALGQQKMAHESAEAERDRQMDMLKAEQDRREQRLAAQQGHKHSMIGEFVKATLAPKPDAKKPKA
jgi:hypothetical protein